MLNILKVISAIHQSLMMTKSKQKQQAISGHKGLYVLVYRSGAAQVYQSYVDPLTGNRRDCLIGSPYTLPWYQILSLVDELHAQIKAGIAPSKRSVSVNEYFDSTYLPWAKCNKRSWADDRSRFNAHCRRTIGETVLDKLSTYQIQHVLDDMAKSYAPATRNRVLALLRKMLALACDWDMLQSNPASKVKLVREYNCCSYLLSDAEIQSLLNAIDQNTASPLVGAVLKIQMSLGLRIGEVLKIQWSQVDFSRRLLTIEAPKNGRTRVVPLGDFALQVFNELQNLALASKYVFPSASDLSSHIVMPYRAIQRIKQAAGLERFSSHGLRRWFASTASNNGMSLHQVSRALGHSTQAVTEARYAFLSTKSLNAVVNSVNQHLSNLH